MTTNPYEVYICDLPYEERTKLCLLLDTEDKWDELGQKMSYTSCDLAKIRLEVSRMRRLSPADHLLTMWGNQNHFVYELFYLLYTMGLYKAMTIIKHFVDPKLHVFIKENNVEPPKRRTPIPDSRVPNENFNKGSTKNQVKKLDCSDENNESAAVAVQNAPNNSPKGDSTKIVSAFVAVSSGSTLIPYAELEVATNNWDSGKILGKGGFGIVFKGKWKYTEVAVKRLGKDWSSDENFKKSFTEYLRQSVTEMHCLNIYRHDNIVPLYGYSIGGAHPCLVYQYMPGGSLDFRIRASDKNKLLSWSTRLKIATGSARGLQFLHTNLHGDKPLIHGDIKSANILLDQTDNPKIGDFGLAREGPDRHKSHIQVTKIQGTLPYLPSEFLRSKKFSTKVDTYSFGIVLFELATGRRPMIGTSPLRDHVVNYSEQNIMELKDARVPEGEDVFSELIAIGKWCVEKKAKERPEMVEVLLKLEEVCERL